MIESAKEPTAVLSANQIIHGPAKITGVNSFGDRAFQREFMVSSQYEHDDQINNNMGLCTLEFDETSDTVQKARMYFERAVKNSRNESSKAFRLTNLAMLDLIDGHQDEAFVRLQLAEETDPKV
jgi:Tfp pilus assembly protein PilF